MTIGKNERAVFEALKKSLKERPYLAPSQRELVQVTGINISSVNDSIKLLEATGFITRTPGTARSLRILKDIPRRPAKAGVA